MKTGKHNLIITLLLLPVFALAQKPQGYKLNVGDKYTVSQSMDQKISQDMMGQTSETTQKVTSTDDYEVMAFENGVYTIKSTSIDKTFELSSPMGSQKMDSEGDGESDLPFSAVDGLSYTFKMNELGEVLEVSGLDKLRDAIAAKMAGTMFEASVAELQEAYGQATIQNSLNTQLYIFPENDKESWTRSYLTVVNNLPVDLSSNFSWDDDKTILADGTVAIDGEIEAMGQTMHSKMEGTQQSIIDLDQASGMPTMVQTLQDMKGSLELQGISIPMTITTEAKMTIEKK